MPATYEPLATFTTDGTTQSIIFSSIPQTYTDLVISVSLRSSTGAVEDTWSIQVNDTLDIYDYGQISSNGSTFVSNRTTGYYGAPAGTCPAASATSGIFNAGTVNFGLYANTVKWKTFVSKSAANANNNAGKVQVTAGTMRTTSALTKINVFTASANMAAGSTATLYGIKAA
jgi:hypothetical protein